MSRSWQSDVQLKYQTNNAATTTLSWIINSFYFEYRSPIQLRNNFISPIQSEMNIFVPKSERIRSDLHTSNRKCCGQFCETTPYKNRFLKRLYIFKFLRELCLVNRLIIVPNSPTFPLPPCDRNWLTPFQLGDE
jgi:hypothetical protein